MICGRKLKTVMRVFSTLNKCIRLKRTGFCVVLLFLLFVTRKLSVIQTGIDVLSKSLKLYKDRLAWQRQAILYNHLKCRSNDRKENEFLIYAITPTYRRIVQRVELTRIAQTLMLLSNVHWIVVEDSDTKTDLVRDLINDSALTVTHLNIKTTVFEKIKNKGRIWSRHRAVEQRNMALKWLRENLKLNKDKGIVYFMDDDNTYHIKLFTEIAKVKKVGVWPVGFIGGWNAERPIVDPITGKVTGYISGWRADREFAIDMAGFAIDLDLILSNPEALFFYGGDLALLEDHFLRYFTTRQELEPLADNCTKVYVWHTRIEKPEIYWTVPDLQV